MKPAERPVRGAWKFFTMEPGAALVRVACPQPLWGWSAGNWAVRTKGTSALHLWTRPHPGTCGWTMFSVQKDLTHYGSAHHLHGSRDWPAPQRKPGSHVPVSSPWPVWKFCSITPLSSSELIK